MNKMSQFLLHTQRTCIVRKAEPTVIFRCLFNAHFQLSGKVMVQLSLKLYLAHADARVIHNPNIIIIKIFFINPAFSPLLLFNISGFFSYLSFSNYISHISYLQPPIIVTCNSPTSAYACTHVKEI